MIHALVLEREPASAEEIRLALQSRGPYRVTATIAPRDALDVLASDRPGLVIVDDLLPEIGGWEFASRATHLRVPVLMLASSELSANRLRRAGCAFVPRPFHIEILLRETRHLLRDAEAHRAKMSDLLDRLLENRADLARAVAIARETVSRSKDDRDARTAQTPSMWRSFKLQVVPRQERGRLIQAPPAVTVRADANYYLCGGCGTLLMVADHDHLRGLTIHCRTCRSYNAASD